MDSLKPVRPELVEGGGRELCPHVFVGRMVEIKLTRYRPGVVIGRRTGGGERPPDTVRRRRCQGRGVSTVVGRVGRSQYHTVKATNFSASGTWRIFETPRLRGV